MSYTIERKVRSRYSTSRQIQQNTKTEKRLQSQNKGYRGLHLKDVVEIVQRDLKELKGSVEEQQAHKDLLEQAGLGNPVAQEKVKAMIKRIITERRISVIDGLPDDKLSVSDAVFALTCGAGWIEDLYKAKDVEEVQVNGTKIYVMRDGIATKINREFESIDQVIQLQQRLALYGKADISELKPVCSTYMWNKSRLTMSQPPYSAFPAIAVRNFILKDPTLESLMEYGTLDKKMATFLRLLVKYHASIMVAGSTKTGKTTTLFALAREIPIEERLLTLETEFEVWLNERLPGRNVVPFQAVPEIGITMEEGFKPLLRFSPDRIIIGEMRGSEAAQAVQACLRGHDSLTSVHSKYRDMIIYDVMDMIKQDGRTHDDHMLRQRIARAFNIVVFQNLVKVNKYKARRVMTEITELQVDPITGNISVVPIVIWNKATNKWEFTGNKLSHGLREHMELYMIGDAHREFEELGVW
ncbi:MULTISPECIES: ATPase, T2SS/T4P/T4SS family [Brevibacillus]|uniref:ATPase, T2SS/T4P/T4SS family n=1 Tax=Brevibacillus brevis TaxID=1393 RepID=A0ABY9TEN0_BREBE|nr:MULTISPECIES: ATPase, T2SS/T4P/T4SS family [Brevibacillus]WNC17901.1 ATPase, T2SS/T4P/T4SS family [Brevibacillus brevis]